MALSHEELELEAAEFLPAREVMCQVWGGGSGFSHNQLSFTSAESNGFINVLSGDNVLSGNNLSVGI
jgi:hypothetical protein